MSAGRDDGPTPDARERAPWGAKRWTLVAAAVAVVVFAPSLANGFAYDDLPIIRDNEALRDLGALPDLLLSPYWPGDRGQEFGLWRPTTTALLAAVWKISGGAPIAFHLVNVVLHATAAALVVRLLAGIFPVALAGVAGVIFAIHPVHVEAVANGVGVAELLAAVLLLAALVPIVRHDRLTTGGTLLVVLLYGLAFGAKESAVVLPGLVFVVDGVRRRLRLGDLGGWLRDRAPLLGGMALVAAVLLWARMEILGGIATAEAPLGAGILPNIPRIHTLGEIWAHMVRLVTLPTWLSPDYAPGVIPILTVWTPRALLGVSSVLGLLVIALVAARRARGRSEGGSPAGPWGAVAFGVVWFVVAVSPTSNVAFLTGVLLAERTLYLPSVGAAAVIAAVLAAPFLRPTPAIRLRGAAAVVGAGLGVAWLLLTLSYIPAWKDQGSIFQHMIETVPESGRSQWALADTRFDRGEIGAAMAHYRAALGRLGPDYLFLTQTGRRQVNAGRTRAALPFLHAAVETRPDGLSATRLLAVTYSGLEAWTEAEWWAGRTLEIDPEDITSHHLLAVALAGQERWAEAAEARRAMVALDPEPWQPWFWLAEVRARAGDLPGAAAAADSVRVRTDREATLAQLDSLGTQLGFAGGG